MWGLLIAVAVGASALTAFNDPMVSPEPPAAPPVTPAQAQKREVVVAGELLGVSPDYAPDVARMLNLLMREHPPCQQSIEPVTAYPVKSPINPANPGFTVVCGAPKKMLVHFTWMDAVNQRIPLQPSPPVVITQSAAADACEKAARSRVARPSSLDMSRFWSAAFEERPDGTAVFQSTFRAANGFGVDDEFQITCHFSGLSLTSTRVQPAG